MQDRRLMWFVAITVGLGVVLLGLSLLLAVYNLGANIFSFWLLLIVQIGLAAIGIIFTLSIVFCVVRWMVGEIESLRRKYADLLEEMKKRTPWFVTFLLLVSQIAIAIADKSFPNQTLPSISMTIALIVIFGISSELMLREQKMVRILGLIVWFAGFFTLPLFVWIDRNYCFDTIWLELNEFPFLYRVSYVILGISLLAFPVLIMGQKNRS